MNSDTSFLRTQYLFANYVRDPASRPAPEGIEERRLRIYSELFYNNIENFISNGFPVLRSITKDDKWHRMVRDFFSKHRCQSPYFLEISKEFIHYLQSDRVSEADDLPFLLELAHYEWIELAVETDTDEIPSDGYDPNGDLMQHRPLVSPLAYVLNYEYPVHRVGVEYLPVEPPNASTFLIVYRNLRDEVHFMEINAITAQLLMLLEGNTEFSGSDAIRALAAQVPDIDEGKLFRGGVQALKQLHRSGIILGTLLER